MTKCVWCGEPAGLHIRVIVNDKGETSGENPICWSCIYNAAEKRLEVKT